MIKAFIERYIAAFLSRDASYINSIYSYPVTFYSETGEAVVFNEEQFAANTQRLLAVYRRLGIAAIDYELLERQALSAQLDLVSIRWRFLEASGDEVYHCTTRYVYRTLDGEIRIPTVFVVDETTNFGRLKAQGRLA